MTHQTRPALHGLLFIVAAMVIPAPASTLDVKFPPETAAYRASDLPGFSLVRQNCMICHSAHYVQSQPPASNRSYW